MRILHQGQTLREVHANITVEVKPSLPSCCPGSHSALCARAEPWHCDCPWQDPDFAEVLSELSAHELQWLVQGQLRIMAETEGRHARQLAGTITTRRSCDSEHGAGTLGCRRGACGPHANLLPCPVPLSLG